MADQSEGEKTEQPSPKKLRDARAKGQVARSQEVVTTISLLSVLAATWFSWRPMMDGFTHMMDVVAGMTQGEFQLNAQLALIFVFRESLVILAPIVAVTIVAAIMANFLQFGVLFSFDTILPKLEKISPLAGAKRIFSLRQLFEIVKAMIKIALLSSIIYFIIKESIGAYLLSLSCGLACEISLTGALMKQLIIQSAILLVLVAAADIAFQRWEYWRNLKMTKQEVKREHKESEGDPHVKHERKRIGHEFIMSDGGQRAREGTAVVVNPTHIAIVIKYEPGRQTLPLVTAKGMEKDAHFLRTEAEKVGVPVFRNVNLARALYFSTAVDEYVPSELYDVVAEVLVWVAQNRELLYKGPLRHGVIDMDLEKQEKSRGKASGGGMVN